MQPLIHVPGIAGCDEAGRGPLAGPVVCAAVILHGEFDVTGLHDSKKLSPSQRASAEGRIKASGVWAVEVVEAEEIDRVNILQASLFGMVRAMERLVPSPAVVYVDGDKVPRSAPYPCEAKVKGDATFACIAAASILAKTERDRIMTRYHDRFPLYGFDKNFGYPTPDHLVALKEHGPCEIHRRTYAPVAELLNQPTFEFHLA